MTVPPPTPAPVVVHRQSHASASVRQAEGVVRHYFQALFAGDEIGAYHALGTSPGDQHASLSEETFIDRSARLVGISGHPDGNGTNVAAEVTTHRGLYFVTLRVEDRDGRPTIVSHDYIKP